MSIRVAPEARDAIEQAATAAGMTASAFVAETMARAVRQGGIASEGAGRVSSGASAIAVAAVNMAPLPANDLDRSVNNASETVAAANTNAPLAQPTKGAGNASVYSQSAAAIAFSAAVNNAPGTKAPSESPVYKDATENEPTLLDIMERPAPASPPAKATVSTAPAATSYSVSGVRITANVPVYGSSPVFTHAIAPQPAAQNRYSTGQLMAAGREIARLQAEADRKFGPNTPKIGISQALKQLHRRPADPPMNLSDPAVIAELKRIGNNINQIAHCVNASLPPDVKFTVKSFQHLFEALTDDVEFRKRLDAIRMRTDFNGTALAQPRRRIP